MMMLGLYSAPPSLGGQLLLDCTPFVQRASCSTDAHGFEGLQTALTRPLRDAFRIYDAPLLYVGLFAHGQIVWEGRLEDPALSAGGQGSGLSLQALGAWRALSDDRYTALWSKTTLDGFRPITSTDNSAFVHERYEFTLENSQLIIAPIKGAVHGNTGASKVGGLGYFLPSAGTRDVVGAQFAVEIVAPAANWRSAFQTRDSSFGGAVTQWTFTTAGAGTTNRAVHVTFASSAQAAIFFFDLQAANVAFAGETGSAYLEVSRMRLVTSSANRVNTTLTANRNAGANVTATVGSTTGMYVGMELVMNSANNPSEVVTVLSIGSSTQFNATFANNYVIGNAVQGFKITADEIVADIVDQISTLNSAQLSSSTALIQSPGVDLTDRVYEDASMIDIISGLAGLGDSSAALWEAGVYEGRMLFFRAKGSASRAWFVDASDLSVARSLEQLANSIYPVYEDASGRTLRGSTQADSTSIARYGLTRRTALPTDTTLAATASLFTATALADRKDPRPHATVQFDAIYDALGGHYPLWLVRAGDTITIRNLPPTLSTSVDRIRTFRISHTSYDAVANTLAVEPELPPPTLEVMLARRAEGIVV